MLDLMSMPIYLIAQKHFMVNIMEFQPCVDCQLYICISSIIEHSSNFLKRWISSWWRYIKLILVIVN